MRLIYFAWVRERIGKPQEEVELPAGIETVADLLAWLQSRGEEYEQALKYPDVIRVAIDQEHVDHREKIEGAREVALFPPMTGG
jgi:molybdopterin synthase sulfur carrier subunit